MRCFVAIELPEEVRGELERLQQRLAAKVRGVRWTSPDLIHLTLKFLGDVAEQDVRAVVEVASGIAAEISPFMIGLEGAGCFPPSGPARIVWAGVANPPAALLACQEACERRYEPLGYPREQRTFRPHLTIGRVKDPRCSTHLRAALQSEQGLRVSDFAADELVIFNSVLSPRGPTYTAIHHAPFRQKQGHPA